VVTAVSAEERDGNVTVTYTVKNVGDKSGRDDVFVTLSQTRDGTATGFGNPVTLDSGADETLTRTIPSQDNRTYYAVVETSDDKRSTRVSPENQSTTALVPLGALGGAALAGLVAARRRD
jgi:hypothetical protein